MGERLSVDDADFRLYELLKNGSRFLRIAGESPRQGRFRQRIKVEK
jgi:hypothetical protein